MTSRDGDSLGNMRNGRPTTGGDCRSAAANQGSVMRPARARKPRWLPSRLVPHRHGPRAELQPAHELQVDMLR